MKKLAFVDKKGISVGEDKHYGLVLARADIKINLQDANYESNILKHIEKILAENDDIYEIKINANGANGMINVFYYPKEGRVKNEA